MIYMEFLCKRAVETFGADSQTMIAIEEMAELQKELCKHFRGRNNYYNIAEEIADVQIMLEQMIILHDCRDAVEDWKFAKLMRLRELIGEASVSEMEQNSEKGE